MSAAILPACLRPLQPPDLLRLGPEADGGYLVDPRDVAAADGLISLGLDRDWRFERAFLRMNRVPVHAYDGCTSVPYILDDLPRAVDDRNWRWAARTLQRTADYVWFFSTSAKHFRRFVGTADFAYEKSGSAVVPLSDVFEAMAATGSSRPYLKVDVEGAEFMMLGDLVARAEDTAGLAIEFHDCDTRLAELVEFVQRYPLRLVHIHANSFGGIGKDGVPRALELTFSSAPDTPGTQGHLPHRLDRANDRGEEISLVFG